MKPKKTTTYKTYEFTPDQCYGLELTEGDDRIIFQGNSWYVARKLRPVEDMVTMLNLDGELVDHRSDDSKTFTIEMCKTK